MTKRSVNNETGLRLAELMAALSLATDLGMGLPMEHALRATLLAVRLGEAFGLNEEELRDTYYLVLLSFVGCTSGAQVSAERFDGAPDAMDDWFTRDFARPAEAMSFVFRNVGRGQPLLRRANVLTSMFAGGKRVWTESNIAHCEVAQRIAERLGFGPNIQSGLWQVFERWDGRGVPGAVRGEEVLPAVRVMQIAHEAESLYRRGGADATLAEARRKSGTQHDPRLVETLCREGPSLLKLLESEPIWETVLAAEPGLKARLSDDQLDTAARAIADFADLMSPYIGNHSSGVAELAAAAARHYGQPEADITAIRRAGLLHDVGRVGVSAGIWNKSGPLTFGEWERVRLYPYYTERIVGRPKVLTQLGNLAALHRERLDGSGYHRGLPASMLTNSARILAAADVYHAMIEPRPYRPALQAEQAAGELRQEVRAGRLDAKFADAVLAAAGHKSSSMRHTRAAGLSEREIEVLRLLARGLSMREIAAVLVVSKKTVDNHIQHIYNKIGVSTRAAAAFFAMQHNLLDSLDLRQE